MGSRTSMKSRLRSKNFRRWRASSSATFRPTISTPGIGPPGRQYVINLSGESEVEVGNGTKRKLGPGDIYLADDTTGQGHISRAVGNQRRVFVTIPLK